MARPIKQGLDYFPLDVDIDQDDKFAMIEAVHGHVGFSVVVRLLAKIYKEGYCYQWSNREQILFANRVNVDINNLIEIVDACMNERIFNKTIYEAHGVLTSKGIQKRYLEAVKRRKQVDFNAEYFLIEDVGPIVGSNKIAVYVTDENGRVNVNVNADEPDGSEKKKPAKAPRRKAAPKADTPKVQTFEMQDMENARLLFELMQGNNPDVKQPNFDKWANDFRLMRTKDNRTDLQIKHVIQWTQNNSFWKSNILSASKLRDQWDRLVVIITEEHNKKNNQKMIGQTNNGDKWEALDLE